MAERITWKAVRGPSERGFVGGIELFALTYHSTGSKDDQPWKLTTRLPMHKILFLAADKDGLKTKAERLLAAFVEKLGAQFPEGFDG